MDRAENSVKRRWRSSLKQPQQSQLSGSLQDDRQFDPMDTSSSRQKRKTSHSRGQQRTPTEYQSSHLPSSSTSGSDDLPLGQIRSRHVKAQPRAFRDDSSSRTVKKPVETGMRQRSGPAPEGGMTPNKQPGSRKRRQSKEASSDDDDLPIAKLAKGPGISPGPTTQPPVSSHYEQDAFQARGRGMNASTDGPPMQSGAVTPQARPASDQLDTADELDKPMQRAAPEASTLHGRDGPDQPQDPGYEQLHDAEAGSELAPVLMPARNDEAQGPSSLEIPDSPDQVAESMQPPDDMLRTTSARAEHAMLPRQDVQQQCLQEPALHGNAVPVGRSHALQDISSAIMNGHPSSSDHAACKREPHRLLSPSRPSSGNEATQMVLQPLQPLSSMIVEDSAGPTPNMAISSDRWTHGGKEPDERGGSPNADASDDQELGRRPKRRRCQPSQPWWERTRSDPVTPEPLAPMQLPADPPNQGPLTAIPATHAGAQAVAVGNAHELVNDELGQPAAHVPASGQEAACELAIGQSIAAALALQQQPASPRQALVDDNAMRQQLLPASTFADMVGSADSANNIIPRSVDLQATSPCQPDGHMHQAPAREPGPSHFPSQPCELGGGSQSAPSRAGPCLTKQPLVAASPRQGIRQDLTSAAVSHLPDAHVPDGHPALSAASTAGEAGPHALQDATRNLAMPRASLTEPFEDHLVNVCHPHLPDPGIGPTTTREPADVLHKPSSPPRGSLDLTGPMCKALLSNPPCEHPMGSAAHAEDLMKEETSAPAFRRSDDSCTMAGPQSAASAAQKQTPETVSCIHRPASHMDNSAIGQADVCGASNTPTTPGPDVLPMSKPCSTPHGQSAACNAQAIDAMHLCSSARTLAGTPAKRSDASRLSMRQEAAGEHAREAITRGPFMSPMRPVTAHAHASVTAQAFSQSLPTLHSPANIVPDSPSQASGSICQQDAERPTPGTQRGSVGLSLA